MHQNSVAKTLRVFSRVLVRAGVSLKTMADGMTYKHNNKIYENRRDTPEYKTMARMWLNLVKNHRNQ